MSVERFDVAILGGGLAGLSTAAALTASTRLSVALVEMRPNPPKGARAVYNDTIQKFGLQDAVLRAYTGMVYRSASGTAAYFDYGDEDSLSALDYRLACAILLGRARDDGLELRSGRAVGMERSGDLRLLLTGGSQIETRMLVDASGAAQWTARQLGVRPSAYASLCYGEILRGCAVEQPHAFTFLAPSSRYGNGGGWFYPLDDSAASFGYSLVTPNPGQPRDTAWRYHAARAEFQPFARQVQGARVEAIEGGAVPLGRVSRFCDDGILRVGDAGGQAHAWSVEGCRPALENGLLAAEVIAGAFDANRFDRAALSAFERAWLRDNHERFWRTESAADVVWSRPDARWEQFLRRYARYSGPAQYWQLRENRAGLFAQVYAVLGYARRRALRALRARRPGR